MLGIGVNAAACREFGQLLVIKAVPLHQSSVLAEQRSCIGRLGGPKEGAANFNLAASTPDLLTSVTSREGGAVHVELIGHTIEIGEGCASSPNGCRLGVEFNEEFARSHEQSGDRLRLEMQDEPGIH